MHAVMHAPHVILITNGCPTVHWMERAPRPRGSLTVAASAPARVPTPREARCAQLLTPGSSVHGRTGHSSLILQGCESSKQAVPVRAGRHCYRRSRLRGNRLPATAISAADGAFRPTAQGARRRNGESKSALVAASTLATWQHTWMAVRSDLQYPTKALTSQVAPRTPWSCVVKATAATGSSRAKHTCPRANVTSGGVSSRSAHAHVDASRIRSHMITTGYGIPPVSVQSSVLQHI